MKPILSARIDDQNAVHTVLTVFNRGGNAGKLTVCTDDAEEIMKRLSPTTVETKKIAYKEGGIVVLNTHNAQYRYRFVQLIEAEMQGELGVILARAFTHPGDQNAGKLTMKVYKDAVQKVLESGVER